MENIRQHDGAFSFFNIFYIIILMLFCGQQLQGKDPVDYVNNRIGNISLLLVPTFPTTHLPNSMLRMIPSHQEFVTDRMNGFPLNIPSHRQGEVLMLMPFSGEMIDFTPNFKYRYDQEISKPYQYSVLLDDCDITVHFAPAAHSAVFSFNYESNGPQYVMLRTVGKGRLDHNGKIWSGYELFNGVKHYFYLEFDAVPVESGSIRSGENPVVFARFAAASHQVNLRYGISYISEEQARKNMQEDKTGFDYRMLAETARIVWNNALGKIQIEGGTENEKTVFYTSLYRCHERMINISEDGKYLGFDGKIHEDGGIPFWTDDWIWDTYRALHPLQILLNPTAESQKLTSYLRMYEQSGWVPTFPCVFGDAHCMNGNHAAAMFADALSKGIRFDVQEAFKAMQHTVMTESMIPWYRGPKTSLDDFYQKNGWFPALHPGEKETVPQVNSFENRQSVAVTLAASFDDWCISRLAKAVTDTKSEKFFLNRSYNYRHLFNSATGFFHPKDSAGNFIQPFNYISSGGIGSRAFYDENNAWTYLWDVQHNVSDLIRLFGGNRPFLSKLDSLFVEDLKVSKWQYYAVHPDATGGVGQFVMGNEPSFHIPYLYNYAGQPWQTQKRVRMLMESWFRNDLMGICGDEDGGGMSAFYVFSAMGFYPVTPGIPVYAIGSPLFTKVVINLENGKSFTVLAKNASWENKYIQSAMLNGKFLDRTWFTHNDILSGGVLELTMGNRPNKSWAITSDAVPPSQGF